MKIRNFFILSLITGLVFTSCKKDDEEKKDAGTDPFEAEYSGLSVDENKANLEKTAMEMLDEVKALENSEAVNVMSNFTNVTGSSFSALSAGAFLGAMDEVGEIKSESFESSQIFAELKSTSEEPNSFSEIWASIEGKYSWNSTTKTWDSTGLSGAVVFEFPGKETDTKNTASITIDNFGAQMIAEPIIKPDEAVDLELLTSLKVSLKYGTTELASYSFSASYKDDGVPTNFSTALALGDFSWSLAMTHSLYSEASLKGSFTHSGDVLVEAYVDASGDWSKSNIENNVVEQNEFIFYDESNQDSIFYNSTEVLVENILKNANAYIQFMNVKVAGVVDMSSFGSKMRALDKQYSESELSLIHI